MYFLAGVLGLVAGLALASLAIRLYRQNCWIFRYDSRLRLIKPHGAVSWTIFSLFSIALLEVLVSRYIDLWNGKPRLDTGYWIFTAWASVWVAGSIAIWSIAASLLLHLAASGEKVRNAALFVNAAGIITPLVVISIAVPLGVIGGNEYRSILLDYGTICRALAVSAESWKPGDELDVASLARLVPTFQSLLSHVDRLGEFARSSYIFYAAASFVLGATIASVGGYFLFTLSRVFRQTNAVLAGSVEDGQRRVRRSLSSLVLILVAFTLLDAGCFAVSVYGSIFPLSLSGTKISTSLTIGSLYLFAFLGLPCAILLVYGAYHAEGRSKATSHVATGRFRDGRSSQRNAFREAEISSAVVTVVVDIHVDGDDAKDDEEKVDHRDLA
ncbi:hypothetical protein JCM3766R1_000735 [Sporobolomyces carnicolor]